MMENSLESFHDHLTHGVLEAGYDRGVLVYNSHNEEKGVVTQSLVDWLFKVSLRHDRRISDIILDEEVVLPRIEGVNIHRVPRETWKVARDYYFKTLGGIIPANCSDFLIAVDNTYVLLGAF